MVRRIRVTREASGRLRIHVGQAGQRKTLTITPEEALIIMEELVDMIDPDEIPASQPTVSPPGMYQQSATFKKLPKGPW